MTTSAGNDNKTQFCCISHEFLRIASTNPNKIAVIHASGVAHLSREFRRQNSTAPDFDGDIATLLEKRVESTSPPLYRGDRSFTYSHVSDAVNSLSSRLHSILLGADDPHLITTQSRGNGGVNHEEGTVQTQESMESVMPSEGVMAESREEYRPKIVGIYMPPSVEYIVAVLSVLRCGEAFLPLDPFWPNERILSVASSSNVDLIIGSQSSFGKSELDKLDESHWLVKSISCPVLNYSIDENIQECNGPTNLAWPCANQKQSSFCYLMYTSGSTGKPKGVCGTEQGLSNRFLWMQGMYPLNGQELLLFKSSVSFIDHMQEFLSAILTACVLVILPFNELKENMYSIIDFLQAYHVNRLTTVPSLMRTILPGLQTLANMRVENSLKLLVLSGETFPLTLWEMLSTTLPKTLVLNLYGSTEVSGDCTYFDCKRMPLILKEEKLTSVPIGLPITNCDVMLHSENGASNEGELYVGGSCIFRGYYNEPNIKPDAFAKLPQSYSCGDSVNAGQGQLYFRTGDLVQQLPSGDFVFLGRKDRIVKFNGQRIALEEIEELLREYPYIDDAAVVCRNNEAELVLLEAFIISKKKERLGELLIPAIRNWMINKLPSVVLPNRFFFMESFPVSPSGKVNYELLVGSALLTKNVKDKVSNIDCSNLLQLIKKAFHDALMVERVCNDDDFFMMGGNSLSAAHVAYSLGIDLRFLYYYPTPFKLCMAILHKNGSCSLHNRLDCCMQINTERQDNHISSNHAEYSSSLESRMISKDNDDDSFPSKRLKRDSTEVTLWGDKSFPWYSPSLLSFSFSRCNKVLHKEKQTLIDTHQTTWSTKVPRVGRGHMNDFWKVYMESCVDASPMLVFKGTDIYLFIGSHSHKFLCINARSGSVQWEIKLEGRIECTAAIVSDFSQVVVGCYMGKIYFLDFLNGRICWTFQTSGKITACCRHMQTIDLLVDQLHSIGDAISLSKHADAIHDGLPEEYHTIVRILNSKDETPSLSEIESELLVEESHFERIRKKSLPTVNVAFVKSSSQQGEDSSISDYESNPQVNLTHSSVSNSETNYSNGYGEISGRGGRNNYRGGRVGGRGRGRGKVRFADVQCQVCKKFGHDALSCWHRFDESITPKSNPNSQHPSNHNTAPNSNPYPYQPYYAPPNPLPYTYPPPPYPPPFNPNQHTNNRNQYSPQVNVATAYPSPSLCWYPDSGASHHVTNVSHNIHQTTPYEGPDQITIGNGQGLNIASSGVSYFSSPLNSSFSLVLKNLLFVPDITKNLMSVSQFCKDNLVFFEFHSDMCLVKCQVTKKILLQGSVGLDGLYKFPNLLQPLGQPVSSSSANNHFKSPNSSHLSFVNTVSSCNNSYALWHARLGHPSTDSLKSVMKLCNISNVNKSNDDFCSYCCLGKSHRLPSHASQTVYASPFELIYTDLWGPAPFTSEQGFNYYVTFVDANTRFTWLYLLKAKSDTLSAFKQFQALVKTQFNLPIKSVQSDWGGEYRPFTKYLTELGIIHRLICPHTHHQNGVVERKHRHIVDMTLTLLSQAQLPLSFWDHATVTSVYLINRLPSSSINGDIPYQKLFNKQADYHFLKTFGCSCFPLLRPYNTHKFQQRTQECIFLGYSLSHKGYKCLTADGRIYISKDVTFNEHSFPYPKLFPTATTPKPSSTPVQSSLSILPTPTHSAHSPIPSPLPNSLGPSPESETAPDIVPSPVPETSQPTTAGTSAPLAAAPAASLVRPDNTHPMCTRAKSGIVKTRINPTLLIAHAEPKNTKIALANPTWRKAMQDEYDALLKNNTWTLTELPPSRSAIGCKWVFRVKENPDGSVNKYKARLVAKGFHQRLGYDYNETFSPVIKPVTVRILLTLAVTNQWPLQQIDVNNAFLNGKLEEEVFMTQPPGFEVSNKQLVCKLNKAIYGLKQAPRAWFDKLKSTLLTYKFQSSKCDPSLFVYSEAKTVVYMLVYVDDIIITGNNPTFIKNLIHNLNSNFSLKDLGALDYFLGVEVHQQRNGTLMLTQTKYIRDLLAKTSMDEANSISSPMVSGCKLTRTGSEDFSDPSLYRSVVGALQYVTITRPELCFSVNKVCQFMSAPTEQHWLAVKRILRYLKGTLHYGLLLQPNFSAAHYSIHAYCDADWASDPDDRRSTSGAAVFLGPNLVSWWSKKQNVVARSSTEAEYRSLAVTAAEVTWIQSLLTELKVPHAPPVVFCDNKSTVSLSHNPVLHNRSKHIELDLYFVREKVLNKQMQVVHVPATDQKADILTKSLSPANFLLYRPKLRVVDAVSNNSC